MSVRSIEVLTEEIFLKNVVLCGFRLPELKAGCLRELRAPFGLVGVQTDVF